MKDKPVAYIINGRVFWNKDSALKYQQPKEWMPDNDIYVMELKSVIEFSGQETSHDLT